MTHVEPPRKTIFGPEPWKDIAVGGSWLYVATYGGYVYRVAKP